MTGPAYSIPLDDYNTVMEDSKESALEETSEQVPKAMLGWNKEDMSALQIWLDAWIEDLKSAHDRKVNEWADQETAYRALDLGPQEEPFVGAPGHVVPLSAMAVDPIVARLDTGIFKASPVFVFKGLRKSYLGYMPALEQWMEYYQRHRMKLRQTLVPRLFEFAKHGTMVLKITQHREVCNTRRYVKGDSWKTEDVKYVSFNGPQVFGVSIGDFMVPPHYQYLQDCPIVVERHRITYQELKRREVAGDVVGVDRLLGQETANALNALEAARADSANYIDPGHQNKFFEVYEIWCDYFYKGKDYKLSIIYHKDTGTFLSHRLNYYFHQKKPYVLIPYTVTNDSLWGIGIVEMTLAFQKMLTDWDRSALANAMLANIRMLIASKDAEIEARPKFYTGRVFRVADPSKDLIPFTAASDVYPSTLTERQNIIGLAEKRTGVSDYLTGRESPIIGSRATATSTLALIQEGTRRVEEVMENLRAGLSEVAQLSMALWIQFGLGDVKDIVFGGEDVADQLTEFFDQVDIDNLHGLLAVDLSATDAANNRSVQQQVQLSIIQVMMNYLQKVIEVGKLATESAMQMPQFTALIAEVMTSARNMFKELLTKYDIRNPEEYLPDLEEFLTSLTPGAQGNPQGATGGPPMQPSVPPVPGPGAVPQGGMPTPNGNGGIPPQPPMAAGQSPIA